MRDLTLTIALAGLVILAPLAAAQPVDSDRTSSAVSPADVLTIAATHSTNGTGTPTANETTAESPTEAESPTPTEPDEDAPTAPGAALAGVVSAQGAEVESNVDERAFDRQLNASQSNHSTAVAIANRHEQLTERLATLRNRSRALDRAHENGSIGESQYRARVTTLAAQTTALQRQANRTERVSRDLPAEARESAGLNTTALETLQRSASELTGRETSRIARSIAGRDVGHSVAEDRRPDHAGGPEDRGPNGNTDDGEHDGRADEDNRGPPDNSDRSRQNDSEDASDRDDRGRNGEPGGNATDESDRGNETADDGDDRSDRGNGDAGEDRGNGKHRAHGDGASDDSGADETSDDADNGGGAEGASDGEQSDRGNSEDAGGDRGGNGNGDASDGSDGGDGDRGNGGGDRENGDNGDPENGSGPP